MERIYVAILLCCMAFALPVLRDQATPTINEPDQVMMNATIETKSMDVIVETPPDNHAVLDAVDVTAETAPLDMKLEVMFYDKDKNPIVVK